MQRVVKSILFLIYIGIPLLLYANQKNLSALFSDAFNAREKNNLEQAAEIYQNIVQKHPTCIQACHRAAHGLRELGQLQKSIQLYKKILEQQPDNAHAHVGLAQAYLVQGDFERGWPEFNWRFGSLIKTPHNFHQKNLSEKRILIRVEWGLGDNIQFIRFAQQLKKQGAIIFVQSYHELVPLFSRCPYIDRVIKCGDAFPPHDIQIPMLSLAHACNTTLDTIPQKIPYLYPDENLVQKWQQIIPKDTFNIGICWQGKGDQHAPASLQKNIPLALFAPVAQLPQVKIYSLQKTENTDKKLPLNITTFDDTFDKMHGRFMDTAAVIKNLDLVITIDTSIAHLAGALGTPVWVLLPKYTDWRWMHNRTDSPWYPTMRLFRQKKGGNWYDVIDEVVNALKPFINAKKHTIFSDNNYLNNLFAHANEYNRTDHYQHAKNLYETMLCTMPDATPIFYNYAYLLRKNGDIDSAIKQYKKVIIKKPKHWAAHYGLGQCYLMQGDLKNGFAEFEWRREDNPRLKQDIKKLKYIMDNNKNWLRGKKILLLSEYGFGDVLHFIRYAQLLHKYGADVSLRSQPELQKLFSSCSYLSNVVTTKQPNNAYDFFIPIMSMPFIFGTTLETIPQNIPYLKPDPERKTFWHNQLKHDTNFKIGLCCEKKDNDRQRPILSRRSIPLHAFKPIIEIPGVSVYCLQKAVDINLEKAPKKIHFFDQNFDTKHGSFCDSAAIIPHLDLVLSIDTALAHLAGALDKKVWMLLPSVPDWRWMQNRSDSPWYPTMRLFRKQKNDPWPDVINNMVSALKPLVKNIIKDKNEAAPL